MNIFFDHQKTPALEDYMRKNADGRSNLGDQIPVMVYRLLEYSLKETLTQTLGKEEQIRLFRDAGYRAGKYFAENLLDLTLPTNDFIAHLQKQLADLKIGILRIENMDAQGERIILTVSEDADCSGMPILGETVCNYDEGFLSGIFSTYTGKKYTTEEIDCWATGDRVCRFRAEVDKK